NNIMRALAMLEKALDRLARQNYFDRSQYPQIFLETEELMNIIRSWIRDFRIFSGVQNFSVLSALLVRELSDMISRLTEICTPLPGKKRVGSRRRIKMQKYLCGSVDRMLGNIAGYLGDLKDNATEIAVGLEKWLYKASEQYFSGISEIRERLPVSSRGEKTYIFPRTDKETYADFASDRKRFRTEVVDRLGGYAHATGHKSSCERSGRYKMIGFRGIPRKTVTVGGKQEIFQIRMVQCSDCCEKFSLLPSFLPREKHFGIDIIGSVVRGIVLFGQSLHASLESLRLSVGGVKSRQTVLNRLKWVGTFHPATVLTRAGVKGSGYLQEDEGFGKEAGVRTYTVIMADPKNLLVWHADYVDSVDEKRLCSSFEKFVQRINFKVLGVTKDKWRPSTNALKNVFYNVRIGFCQLHCLKKLSRALSEYRKETKCSSEEVGRLRKEYKKVLETSASGTSLRIKLRSPEKDPAFSHPLLRPRLADLKENAVHYTSHKNRKGITKTTSVADNFLKMVKRKLRQAESF
ncbi:MAG: hypothetical protein GY735_10190, partial [Delftia sp.]|nr:hypothetical protein [Delftia sp.]